MNAKEVKKLRQNTRKAVGRAAEEAAKQATETLAIRGNDLLFAIRQTWSLRERLGLCWWLLFGKGEWKPEASHGSDS